MTLAQNRQQPLNGNKHFIGIIIFILLSKLSLACGGSVVTPVFTQIDSNQIIVKQIDSTAIKDSLTQANLHFKDVYNIALLLPLYLDSVNKFYEIDEEPIYSKSLLGIEFYEGILLGIEELKDTPINLKINVYDTRKSIATVEKILLDTTFKKNDLIIGPIYNNTGRFVARYAKNNKIPMFTPFSPSTRITEKNPYYIMLRASIERHCDKIFDFIKNNSTEKKLFIIHRDDPFENELAEYFHQIIRDDSNSYLAQNDSLIYTFKMSFEDKLDSTMLDNSLDSIKQNYIVVPSFNEAFANHALNQFHRFSDRHPSIAFGMPNWENFHSIRIDNLTDLNVHLTKDYIIDNNNPLTKSIRDKYRQKYKGQAEQYCYTAYDLIQYITKLLKKYGTDFNHYITKEQSNNTITKYNFHYKMILNKEKEEEINYIENNHAYLLRFDNFEWVKVENE